MSKITNEQIDKIGQVLNDQQRPLKERFRALFTLKNIGGDQSITWISKCFEDPSALLKHELAYCLGQMQDVNAIPILMSVLKNHQQEPMVRHEAAEALGAIGNESVLSVLEEFKHDPTIEVAETCQLALARLGWLKNNSCTGKKSIYYSVDPAPPSEEKDVESLKNMLLDDRATLFDRYKAMFALRDLKTENSINALSEGLSVGSALFRHEVAFVLGQLQEECSVPALIKALEDKSQNEMVRHECAEALGAIATDDCLKVLQKYLNDDKRVVKESCEIALDMCDYENSPEFQYANTLLEVS
ncbi:deoxyhypusine hydroxylase [Nilaparvata lugens]|uniref:deoxyhypusine hydroxylase n=1 Tax=Nilaparvata lugens TaxID=108931 RepID=UPI000B99435A|nr:deoxyhypusine hydroxylase [Nilaparvata lugens]